MAAPEAPEANTVAAWGGAILAFVGGAWVIIQKFWLNAKLPNAAAAAQLDVINMLKEQLDAANERATQAMEARDAALDTIRQLKDQVAALTTQVQKLESTVKASITTPST